MAAILKCWREAATLVLIAKSRHKISGSFISAARYNRTPLESSNNTLSQYNYDILTLKRSTNSTFMPDVYVFPGGIADDTDFSPEWLDIYKSTKLQKWLEFVKRGGEGPYMFNRKRSPEYEYVPSELAFRICAIRETFEESGVLLVRHANQCNLLETGYDYKNPISGTVSKLDNSLTESWRKRVDKDSTEFLKMCRELNVIPDVWSLAEWSNWLTPTLSKYTTNKKGRRYDTAFFMCVLDDVPIANHDTKETVHSQWCPPDDLIRSYISSKGGFAPPQVCELSRLLNFKDVDDLHSFSWHRSRKRVDRWFPAPTFCEDGVIVLYPGDELYPQSPDFEGINPLPQVTDTIKEMSQICDKRNRLEIPFSNPPGLVGHMNCNIEPLDGQVKPVTELDFLGLPNDKL